MDNEARFAAFLSLSAFVAGESVDDGYEKLSAAKAEGSATKGAAPSPFVEDASRDRLRMDFKFLAEIGRAHV